VAGGPVQRGVEKFIASLARLPWIGLRLQRAYWKYIAWKTDPKRRIRRAMAGREAVSVLVIGANDGPSTDPIFPLMHEHPHWRGTFVEPVPYLFEKLRWNYAARADCTFVNAAVSTTTGTLRFHYVSPDARKQHPEFPTWVEQLGTFDKSIILDALEGRLEPYIVELEIEAITLAELFVRANITSIDVLMIDTEGHDWKILQQLDLLRFKPGVILFENCFLSPLDRAAARRFLDPFYQIEDLGKDYFCLRKRTAP
jgi:FkbM family methyltransferase